jgi:predicted patatin/cPLA2 family phospholipase
MRCDTQVIERLLARKKSRNDDYKIGLIVQGGGMRGAFSSGAMMGLDDIGLTNAFDYVYGASSGSCATAYFLSGQIQESGPIYWEYLYNFRFIKPWKINKILDLDYLCDDLFRNEHRLNIKKLSKNPATLKIFLTDSVSGRSEFITNKQDDDIVTAIKASCSLPAYYRAPIMLNGRSYYDGNVGKALAFEEALRDGCTDLLVVTTVAENAKDSPFLSKFLAIGFNKKVRAMVNAKLLNYHENLDMVFGRKKFRGINIYTISPEGTLYRGEIRQKVLEKSGMQGRDKVLQAFKQGEK